MTRAKDYMDEMIWVNVRVTGDVHRELKHRAIDRKMSLQRYAALVLTESVKK